MSQSEFCPDRMLVMRQQIEQSVDTSIIGMPGVGIATFLIELTKQPFGHMIFVDAHVLPRYTTDNLARALLQKLGDDPEQKSFDQVVRAIVLRLESLCKKHERIVISIGGFDKLQAQFNTELFHTLITLKGVNFRKIIFMLGVCRRLDSLISDKMINTDLRFFSSVFYLKPYESKDIEYLLPIYSSQAALEHPRFGELVSYSGGNFQFTRLVLVSQHQHNFTHDPLIKLAFGNIWGSLNNQQKTLIKQIAQNGHSNKSDDFLLGIGLIVKDDQHFKLFCQLFIDCVLAYTLTRLPAKEQKLFRLLKKNMGQVVMKQEICDLLWPEEPATEWALNALVYRLRRHPAFLAQNYELESVKKVGYVLTKN